MTTESLEELRQRLLRDESVREMISARAYEIYRMRGVQPGGPAQDWFQAESEVLAFILAHYPEQPEKEDEQIAAPAITHDPPEPVTPLAIRKKGKPRSASNSAARSATKKPAAKKVVTKQRKSKKASVAKPKSKRSGKESKSEDKTV